LDLAPQVLRDLVEGIGLSGAPPPRQYRASP
jgi:hypothetical protein